MGNCKPSGEGTIGAGGPDSGASYTGGGVFTRVVNASTAGTNEPIASCKDLAMVAKLDTCCSKPWKRSALTDVPVSTAGDPGSGKDAMAPLP